MSARKEGLDIEHTLGHILGHSVFVTRKQLGMSQKLLAERSSLHLNTIKEIEGGKGNPRLRTLEQIAHMLGISVTDLLQSTSTPSVNTKPPTLLDEATDTWASF